MLKTYQQIQSIDKNAPCTEYPGTWIVYLGPEYKNDLKSFDKYDLAIQYAKKISNRNIKGSVWWKCSFNDPRIFRLDFQQTFKAYEF